MESSDWDLDHRVEQCDYPGLPFDGGPVARWAIGLRRQWGWQHSAQSGERGDLRATLPVPGTAANHHDRCGAVEVRPERRAHYPGRGEHRQGQPPASQLDHPRLRHESALRPAQLHEAVGCHHDHDPDIEDQGAKRALHGVYPERDRRALGGENHSDYVTRITTCGTTRAPVAERVVRPGPSVYRFRTSGDNEVPDSSPDS